MLDHLGPFFASLFIFPESPPPLVFLLLFHLNLTIFCALYFVLTVTPPPPPSSVSTLPTG